MNTGASEFLPREEAVATEGDDAAAPTQEEYVNSLLRLSAEEGEERPAADSDGEGKGQDMDLQQRLNAAFQNSKESRKQGSATGPTEISLAAAGLDWKPQYQGRLRSFVEQKGFGFIDCQETYSLYGRDVFVHRMQIQESGVIVGQHVYFDVELNNKGHPQARNIVAVNPHEAMQWGDPYNSWGYGNMSYGNYGGCGFNGGYTYGGGGGSSGGGNNNRNTFEPPASDTLPQFEEELRKCNTEQAINDIIELYGQHFTKGHVVAALYQLGLCRQKPRSDSEPKNVGLAAALLERIMQIPSKTFAAEEASRVVWALAALDEVQTNSRAGEYAMELGAQARARLSEFNPAQMATLVGALSRIVRKPSDDALVAEITTKFSEYASGNGSFPKFPQQDLKIWTQFLVEASQPQQNAQMPQMQMQGNQQGSMGMVQGMQAMNPMANMQNQNMQDMPGMGMRGCGGQFQGMGQGSGGCMGGGMGGCGGMGLSPDQAQHLNQVQMQALQRQSACGGCGCQGMQNRPQMNLEQMQQMKGGMPGMSGCKGGNLMQGPGKGMQGMQNMPMSAMKGGGMQQGKGPLGGMRPDNNPMLPSQNMKAGLPGMMGSSKGGAVGFSKGELMSDDKGKGMPKGKGIDKGSGKGKSKDGKDSKGKFKGKDGNGKPGPPGPPGPPSPSPGYEPLDD